MLAVVIPYYKYTFFEDTLQSLVNQTNKRFKVYIGDDASNKDPLDLLEKFKGQFNFEYFRFEENLGGVSLTKQWERCIALTSDEEWIMLLGDDDYISENYVEKFYNNLDDINQLSINVIHFASRIHHANGALSKLYTHPKIENATDSFYKIYFAKDSRGTLTEQIFKKEAYLKHGFRDFPLGWGADHFAWLDFTDFGKIFGINDAIAYFRISNENISRPEYKGEIKKNSKHLLFELLIDNYLKKFTKQQRLEIILHYERLTYRYKKVSIRFCIKMCKLLAKENKFSQMVTSILKYYKFTRNTF